MPAEHSQGPVVGEKRPTKHIVWAMKGVGNERERDM